MDTIRVRRSAKRQFVAWDDAGHAVVMDARSEHKGESTGMRPLQIVLAGLAGCTAMDVISILDKKRQDVRAIEIEVEADQREDDYPKIYTAIRVHYLVTGYGVLPDAVARAIELSEEKYCAVKGMFGPQVDITTTFEVLEAAEPKAASSR